MAATELRDEAESLRRQRRLVEAALDTGLAGEQRRVQTALLHETCVELAQAERALRAVAAGWEPFEPSAAWFHGYVEDPRFLRGQLRLASALMSLPLTAAATTAAFFAWDRLPALLLGAVLLLGLQPALEAVLTGMARERDSRRLAGQPDLRMFNAPLPAHAAVAYRRARESGLFDTFTVHSPRKQDFRAVSVAEAPSLGLLDPVLAGRIGRRSFLIAQWDLARDLAEV